MAERKAKRSAEIEQEILERMSDGEPLAVICRSKHMPTDRAVRQWQEQDAVFATAIARARETGFDKIALEALRISDTPVEGSIITEKADGTKDIRKEDMLGHRKLQVETRLKLLAKWDPKRYGELIKHGNADGSNIDLSDRLTSARERVMRGD